MIPLYTIARSSNYRLNRINTWLSGKCDIGNIIEYEELLVVTDLRGSIPRRTILYKNGLEIVSADINNLPIISILNGPVQAGFNGELIGSLPNSYSDFISSIIGEEYGFFGLFLLVFAFLILITTTFFIAVSEKNEMKKLIAVGFGSWILDKNGRSSSKC